MLDGEVRVAALDEQEGESVVRAGKCRVNLQRFAIRADRFFYPPNLGKRDGEVLKDLEIVRVLAAAVTSTAVGP